MNTSTIISIVCLVIIVVIVISLIMYTKGYMGGQPKFIKKAIERTLTCDDLKDMIKYNDMNYIDKYIIDSYNLSEKENKEIQLYIDELKFECELSESEKVLFDKSKIFIRKILKNIITCEELKEFQNLKSVDNARENDIIRHSVNLISMEMNISRSQIDEMINQVAEGCLFEKYESKISKLMSDDGTCDDWKTLNQTYTNSPEEWRSFAKGYFIEKDSNKFAKFVGMMGEYELLCKDFNDEQIDEYHRVKDTVEKIFDKTATCEEARLNTSVLSSSDIEKIYKNIGMKKGNNEQEVLNMYNDMQTYYNTECSN